MENNLPNRSNENEIAGIGFSKKKASGILPNRLPEPLLLNLGCGKDVRDGFINIDLFSDDPRVVFMDIRNLSFPDNSADIILASDILEHFSHREINHILKEWSRVLKPNGELIIRSPSLKLQTKAYLEGKWNADIASYMIFGGQTNPGDYHCVAFDKDSIQTYLKNAGLELYHFEEIDLPQDKGLINLNFIARAKKIANEEVTSFNPTNEKLEINNEPNLNEISSNIEMLEELVNLDKNQSVNKKEKFLNIVWEGSQFVYHSLALINREHCSNLIDANIANVTIIPYESDQFSYEERPKYKKLLENDIRYKNEVDENIAKLPYVWIRHQWPPKAEEPKGAKWIIMQPWEYTQIPKEILEIFKQADQIWTPSNFSRQCFIDAGIDYNKVQIVPNGIDPNLFKPIGNKYKIDTQKKLIFLYCGGTIYRKGIDILLNSYVKTFTIDDDVCLVVKDMGGDTFYQNQTAKGLIQQIQSNPLAPEIIYIDKYLNEEEIASLYRACDVLVAPYRGEGFSLPTLEAMASGLPVVVTNGGATEDFVLDSFSWKIEADAKSMGTHLGHYQLDQEAFLLEPDEEDLSLILKSIYKNPSVLFSRGLVASSYARKFWNWRNATMKLISLLDGLYRTKMGKIADKRLPRFNDKFIELGELEDNFLLNNFEEVEILAEQLLQLDFDKKVKKHIFKRQIQSKISLNKIESAKSLIENYLQLFGTDNDVEYLATLIFAIEGKTTEGLEALSKLMDEWKNYKFISTLGINLDDLLTLTADLLLSTKENYIDALDVYELALKENPENSQACYGSAIALYQLGFSAKAQTMINWAIELEPDFIEAQNFKNFLETETGKL
jgi:glycosyltransferase involved in cell wall biosynthesis